MPVHPVVQATLTQRYTTRALDFMERSHKQSRSFFLYFAQMLVHKPRAASETFYTHGQVGGRQLGAQAARQILDGDQRELSSAFDEVYEQLFVDPGSEGDCGNTQDAVLDHAPELFNQEHLSSFPLRSSGAPNVGGLH